MRNMVGQWVQGDDFWGREREVRELIRMLDTGQDVLLAAPRRVGKTSLMREVSRRLEDRYTCLHVDLEASPTAADAVAELAVAAWQVMPLRERTQAVFRNALSTLKRTDSVALAELGLRFREAAAGAWVEKGDALLEQLSLAERPVVLFLDELPVLVNRLLHGHDHRITPERREAADRFLGWLRRTSQRGGRLRLVLSGSIGLEPVLRHGGLSAHINAYAPLRLDPWDPPTALDFLRRLSTSEGNRLQVEDVALERITSLLGSCVPYHVQLFFHHLRLRDELERERGRASPCGVTDVEWVYEHAMMTGGGPHLAHAEERLRTVLFADALLAHDLLTEAAVVGVLQGDAALALARARVGDDRDAAAVLRQVLDVLEHDGYLRQRPRPGGHEHVSGLLRDWWRRRHEAGYVPFAERPR